MATTEDTNMAIDNLVALLRSWLDDYQFGDNDLIFRSRNGGRLSESNWGRAWRLALRKIGHERLRPYDCRHFAATSWLNAGVPLAEVARRMGHSVETLVSTYVGALKGDEDASNQLIDSYRFTAIATEDSTMISENTRQL